MFKKYIQKIMVGGLLLTGTISHTPIQALDLSIIGDINIIVKLFSDAANLLNTFTENYLPRIDTELPVIEKAIRFSQDESNSDLERIQLSLEIIKRIIPIIKEILDPQNGLAIIALNLLNECNDKIIRKLEPNIATSIITVTQPLINSIEPANQALKIIESKLPLILDIIIGTNQLLAPLRGDTKGETVTLVG